MATQEQLDSVRDLHELNYKGLAGYREGGISATS